MKKTYKMEVDCANCAAKMERAIAKIDGVKSVNISFMTQKISIDADDSRFDEIICLADKVCRKVDRDACIYLESGK